MIQNVMRTAAMNLRRDRAALVLNFVLPVVFFSIFAGIFAGNARRESMPRIKVALADLDKSPASAQLVAALQNEKALQVLLEPAARKDAVHPAPFDAASAEAMVRNGDISVAIIIPSGFGASLQPTPAQATPSPDSPAARRPPVQILADTSDPISPQVVNGLLQKAAMTSMPSFYAGLGTKYIDQWVGGFSPEQRKRIDENMNRLQNLPAASLNRGDSDSNMIQVQTRDVMGEKKKNPAVAFYAAGIGVMFLLFTAANAGGALLEEAESGTLDRILSTRVSMTQLLLGKLAFLTCLGTTQLIVMFVWGALAFKVELWTHLAGFFIMTITTAFAASAFGLLLASLARTRPQLGALSTLLILSMSALGGSMFPRFLMPEAMKKIGLITFNAWAIDGYIKVFWREAPIAELWPQVLVLGTATIVFFLIARQLARRWEYS